MLVPQGRRMSDDQPLVDEHGRPVRCGCGNPAVRYLPGPHDRPMPTCITRAEGERIIAQLRAGSDRLPPMGEMD
jgi:hypothetical protein